MSEDVEQAFFDHLTEVVGEHGEPDHPPDDYPDVEEAGRTEMASWLAEAALYLQAHTWEAAIDSAFGTAVPECEKERPEDCSTEATHAVDFGDWSRGLYCEEHMRRAREEFGEEVTVREIDWL